MQKLTFSHYVALSSSAAVLAVLIACSGATTSSLESPGGDSATEPGPSATNGAETETDDAQETTVPPLIAARPEPSKSEQTAARVLDLPGDADLVALVVKALEGDESGGLPRITSNQLRAGMICDLASTAKVSTVGDDFIQVRFDDSDYTAFVVGMDAGRIASGANLNLGTVKVEGVQQYDTILGARSSGFVLNPISESEWLQAKAKAEAVIRANQASEAEAAIAEAAEKIEALPMRTWSDASGKFNVEAKLANVSSGVVSLEKADGSTADVPLERLSEADQTYVKDNVRPLSNWKREITRNRAMLDRIE